MCSGKSSIRHTEQDRMRNIMEQEEVFRSNYPDNSLLTRVSGWNRAERCSKGDEGNE